MQVRRILGAVRSILCKLGEYWAPLGHTVQVRQILGAVRSILCKLGEYWAPLGPYCAS